MLSERWISWLALTQLKECIKVYGPSKIAIFSCSLLFFCPCHFAHYFLLYVFLLLLHFTMLFLFFFVKWKKSIIQHKNCAIETKMRFLRMCGFDIHKLILKSLKVTLWLYLAAIRFRLSLWMFWPIWLDKLQFLISYFRLCTEKSTIQTKEIHNNKTK